MPTLAVVEGVKIQIYAQEHPPPHFHAVLAEHRAQFEIETLRLMKGQLPRNKREIVVSWAESRRAALLVAWEMIASGERPENIR